EVAISINRAQPEIRSAQRTIEISLTRTWHDEAFEVTVPAADRLAPHRLLERVGERREYVQHVVSRFDADRVLALAERGSEVGAAHQLDRQDKVADRFFACLRRSDVMRDQVSEFVIDASTSKLDLRHRRFEETETVRVGTVDRSEAAKCIGDRVPVWI